MNLEIENRIVEEIFARSEAYENLLVLADDIGVRFPGTPNEIRARDFLVETLSSYGLDDVHTEAFPHRAWTPVREELQITAPIEREVVCQCAALSPSTPAAGLEGEGVFFERADLQEFEARKQQVKGRFLVAPYDGVPRQFKTQFAAQYGAIGFIGWHHTQGLHRPAGTCAFEKVGAIPVASITYEDGAYLRRLESRKGALRLKLRLDSRVEQKDSWNVVGEVRGAGDGEEQIVIGAHYDSHHISPGATDDASGVVAVLETARGLAQYREHLQRTVKVVLFGVEETGLVGAWAYTHHHRDELDNIILMVNNDAFGGRPWGITIQGCNELKPPMEEIARRVRIAGENLPPFQVEVQYPGGWGADQVPFMLQGVPTMMPTTAPFRPNDFACYHIATDTVDKVYGAGLTECAAINAQIIFQFANTFTRPAARKTQSEMEKMFRLHHNNAPRHSTLSFWDALDLLDMWPPEHVMRRYFSFGPR